MSNEVVDRARSLIGTRFRAQGREPLSGVDCLGLAMLAYEVDAGAIRRDYRLGGDHRRELMEGLAHGFRRVAKSRTLAGDLMLLQISNDQFHLAIGTGAGFVHADARREVVETPGLPAWPVVAVFRKRVRRMQGKG